MDELLKRELGLNLLKPTGRKASGCINEGQTYETDSGYLFIKRNKGSQAKLMFDSEFASLLEIYKTKTVRVPKPIKVISAGEDHFIAMEHIDMKSLNKHSSELGEQLANLHLYNEIVAKNDGSSVPYTGKFGFHIPTSCGRIIHDNTWSDDWPTFYARTRLDFQVNLLQKNTGDREVGELWSGLQIIIPKFFENIEIKPSLIHGDLWGGNVGETNSEPVIYDPGSLYAHHEFEMGMTNIFGGFDKHFYKAYFSKVPKSTGFTAREKLYELFHYLNHWYV